MSQKRGQLSVFVIVGLVVVILGGLGVYLYSNLTGSTPEQQLRGDNPLSQMQGLMEDCVRAQAVPLLQRISAGGGTFTPNRLWKGQKYNILCVDTGITGCVNTLKTKKDVAEEFNSAFTPLLEACLDFRQFEKMGFTVDRGALATATIVGFDDVSIAVRMPITLTRGDDKISYSEQVIRIDSPLGQLHSLANVMLNQHVRLGYIDKEALMLKYGDSYHIEIDRPYPDTVISIVTKDRNERPYVFRFGQKGIATAKTAASPRPKPRLQDNCLINFDCFDNVPEAFCTQKEGAVVAPDDARCQPPFIEQPLCDGQPCLPCQVSGKEAKHGEQWCDSTTIRQNGLDPVGSRHVKYSCVNGKVLIEPCRDFREEMCTDDGNLSECRINRWFDCWKQTDKAACEDVSARDCFWEDGLVPMADERSTSRCRAVVPVGQTHWVGSKTSLRTICQTGNEQMTEDIGYFSQALSWKPYIPHATGMAYFCEAMGDCGNQVGVSDVPADKRFKSSSGKPPVSTYRPAADVMPKLPVNTTGFSGVDASTWYYPTGEPSYMRGRTNDYINWLISNAIPILFNQVPIHILHSNHCKGWMPRKALEDCDKCEKSPAGCSEYLCRSLGRKCVFTTDVGGYPHCRLGKKSNPLQVELDFPGHPATKTRSGYRLDTPATPFEMLTINIRSDRPTICVASLIPGIDGIAELEDGDDSDGVLEFLRMLIAGALGPAFDPEMADFAEPTTAQAMAFDVPDLSFIGRYDQKSTFLGFAADPLAITKMTAELTIGLIDQDPDLADTIEPFRDRVSSLNEKMTAELQKNKEFNSLGNKVDILLAVNGLRQDPRVLTVFLRCDDELGEADSVQIPIEIPIGKDNKPPVVLNATPQAGALTPAFMDIRLSEPSVCGYSMDADKQFPDMLPMSCDVTRWGSRTCNAPLLGKGASHTVYVRCRDRPWAFVYGDIGPQDGLASVGGVIRSTSPLNISVMPFTHRSHFVVAPKGMMQMQLNFVNDYLCRYGYQNVSYDQMGQQMQCDDNHCSASIDTSQTTFFACADAQSPYQNEMTQPYVIRYDGSVAEQAGTKNETALVEPEETEA